jgi:hypothetical protein
VIENPKVDSKVVFVGRVHPKPQKMVETCIVSEVQIPVVLVVRMSVVVGLDNVVVHKTKPVVR